MGDQLTKEAEDRESSIISPQIPVEVNKPVDVNLAQLLHCEGNSFRVSENR